MLENLKRLREPAAWITLAVTATSIVLALIRFGVELSTGTGFPAAAQNVALTSMNLTFVVVLVALVWACVFVEPPTPRSAQLVTLSAVVVTVGTLLTLLGSLLGLAASAGVLGVVLEFLGGLLDIILKGVGAVTLWLVHRGLQGGRIPRAEGAVTPAIEEVAEPPRAPITWSADAAAGSVWTSASDAAAGAPASGFGVPGTPGGWRPVGRPQSPRAIEPTDDDDAR